MGKASLLGLGHLRQFAHKEVRRPRFMHGQQRRREHDHADRSPQGEGRRRLLAVPHPRPPARREQDRSEVGNRIVPGYDATKVYPGVISAKRPGDEVSDPDDHAPRTLQRGRLSAVAERPHPEPREGQGEDGGLEGRGLGRDAEVADHESLRDGLERVRRPSKRVHGLVGILALEAHLDLDAPRPEPEEDTHGRDRRQQGHDRRPPGPGPAVGQQVGRARQPRRVADRPEPSRDDRGEGGEAQAPGPAGPPPRLEEEQRDQDAEPRP